MTATPALMSGLPVASPSSGAADAGMEEGDASFGDALEQVFLSTLSALKDGGPGRGKFLGSSVGEDGDRDPDAQRDAAQVSDRIGTANLVLATLQNSAGASTGAEGAGGTASAAGLQATGPWMPGQVEDGESAFDTVQLLDALSTDATRAAGREAAGAEFTENTTLRVLRKETHLAVMRAPVSVSATLGGLEEAARALASETSQPVPSIEDALRPVANDAAPLGAVVARSHGDAAQVRRDTLNVQADVTPNDGAQKSGAASSLSFENAAGQAAGQNADGDGRQGSRGEREVSSQTTNAVSIGLDGTRTQAVRDASGEVVYETPAEQIFSEVRTELDTEPALQTSTDGAKKVLHLELKPASLGSVTVRIALKDNVVTLHLEAARSETLAAIERDHEALAGALKSAGYTVDAITSSVQTDGGRLNGIVAAGADANSAAPQGNPQGAFAQGANEGGANSSGQGRSGQSMSENHGERAQSDQSRDLGRVSQGGSDGLYV